MIRFRRGTLLVSLAFATMYPASIPATAQHAVVHIATWNLEWLVTPATAHAGRMACRRGRRGTLPCGVAERARDSADIARLAAYARRTGADVFAFQEVESEAIARQVFAGYHICVAPGRGVQHVGFAVRRTLPHRCAEPVESLALGGTQRAGLTLWIAPGTPAAIELLAVHLKSGCADADLESGGNACGLLSRQAEVLAGWIAARARARFMVLGDFNRGDSHAAEDSFWLRLAGGAWNEAPFVHAGAAEPFRNCHRGAPFSRAIDHILVAGELRDAVIDDSYERVRYTSLDALRYRLSDHCPVRISLNLHPATRADAD
jgi:endonuclease/exonuclease/phosphatase family metal-dependent hydrolase